jgi:predicted membrane protein
MRHLDIQLGAAGFVVTNLGNANVASIRVNGGVGSIDLDFGGTMRDDVSVEANLALGKLALHLPQDVGVRVEVQKLLASFDHRGLYKRGSAYYSDNWDSAKVRVRVRAETVFGAIEIERDR